MRCYNHRTVEAVGQCTLCHKGLCENCCDEGKIVLSCNGDCRQKIDEGIELQERIKKLYNIGTGPDKKKIPPSAIFFFLMGLLFSGWGLYDGVFFLLPAGILFILYGFVNWIRAYQTGLNV